MKKLISAVLALVMLLSVAPMSAYAAKGPMGKMTEGDYTYYPAYISAWELKKDGTPKPTKDGAFVWKNIYSGNKTNNKALKGATYSKKTNTLTLNKVNQPYMVLETNVMGDDFKIKVIGNCALSSIRVFGYGYGGSLKITGTGTLTVNKKKLADTAITLFSEEAKSKLEFDKSVTVQLYAKKAVVVSDCNKISKTSAAVRFANDNVKVKKYDYSYEEEESVSGYFGDGMELYAGYKTTYSKDPNGLYTTFESEFLRDDKYIEGYTVTKLIYSKTFKKYFEDHSYNNGGSRDFTKSEYKNAGFAIVKDSNGNNVSHNFKYISGFSTVCKVYKDSNGNKYVVDTDWSDETGNTKIVYNYKEIPEIKGYYYLTVNKKVSASKLKQSIKNVKVKGAYTYAIEKKSLVYNKRPTLKLKAASKGFSAKWDKVSGVKGYELQYSTDKSFKKNVTKVKLSSAKKVSAKISKLEAKKTYYVRVRTVKKISKKNYYSAWSAVKSVKTK